MEDEAIPEDISKEARRVVCNWYDSGYYEELIEDVASALLAERAQERARCLALVDEAKMWLLNAGDEYAEEHATWKADVVMECAQYVQVARNSIAKP